MRAKPGTSSACRSANLRRHRTASAPCAVGAGHASALRRRAHLDRGHQGRAEAVRRAIAKSKSARDADLDLHRRRRLPVKPEIYRVAERHALKHRSKSTSSATAHRGAATCDDRARVVGAAWMRQLDRGARSAAIVITADVPLASRCVKSGAEAIAPIGRAFIGAGSGHRASASALDSARRPVSRRRWNQDLPGRLIFASATSR